MTGNGYTQGMHYPDIDPTEVQWHEGRLPIHYRPFTWAQRDRPGAITIPEGTSAVLIEGAGVARRELRPWLDAVVWIYARADVGRRRVIAKGVDTEDFVDHWMSEENDFLADHRPWEIADVIVAGELGQPALTGRYGNVVTATEPAHVTKRQS
jgi:hypothetical protein